MTFCPRCGSELDQIDLRLYYCRKCRAVWLVDKDETEHKETSITLLETLDKIQLATTAILREILRLIITNHEKQQKNNTNKKQGEK